MKNKLKFESFQHVIVVFVFIAICLAYFYPLLQNKDLVQSDMVNVQGMSKELKDYHQKTGEYAQWTNAMFGGMPAYQIYGAPPSNIYFYIGQIIQKPFSYTSFAIILMALICFYILLITLGVSSWLAAIGAFAYAFGSYNFIIIDAGHITKAYAIASLPLVIAGFITIFNKKYIGGGLLLAIGLGLNIAQSHFQITYYILLAIGIYLIVEFIYSIKEKLLMHFAKSMAVIFIATILALLPNLYELYKTYDYGNESMRGPSELTLDNSRNNQGLDKDYAFGWSYGKMESLTLLIPNIYGGSSHYELSKSSNLYQELIDKGVPEWDARKAIEAVPTYWGAQPFTSGPVYIGAIICFLFVLGLVLVKGRMKWWLLSVAVLGLILSWGKNFPMINYFFFDFLPGYNKFRTVSMILVLPCFAMALLGILALKEIITGNNSKENVKKAMIIAGGATGGLSLLFALLGAGMFNFAGINDQAMITQGFPQWYLDAIVADRISMFRWDAFRSFLYVALAFGAIWFYISNKIKTQYLLLALSLLIVVDLYMVDKRFLNYEDFEPKPKIARVISASENDVAIMDDKDLGYRVFNAAGNPFNDARTSYFHHSIGGYHGAKLRRYQDVIETQFSKGINVKVLNMLNTRYFIAPSEGGRPIVQRNTAALGNAWFVDTLKIVENADAELAALSTFEPATTAIVDKRFEDFTKTWSKSKDSLSTIKLTEYAPGKLTYIVDAKQNELAVFSEIYYPKYWNITIDGQKAEMFRANYILRSMIVPKGTHTIEFKFIPTPWNIANKVSLYSSFLIGLIILGYFGWVVYSLKRRKE